MQITSQQYDGFELQAREHFGEELDAYLRDRFPEVSAVAFAVLRRACDAACRRWRIRSGKGVTAFNEASFLLGRPLDQADEFMMALTRAVLIGWAPDQVAIDLMDRHG